MCLPAPAIRYTTFVVILPNGDLSSRHADRVGHGYSHRDRLARRPCRCDRLAGADEISLTEQAARKENVVLTLHAVDVEVRISRSRNDLSIAIGILDQRRHPIARRAQ